MVVIYTWLGTDTSRGFPCCTCVFCTTEPLAPNAELNLSATLVFCIRYTHMSVYEICVYYFDISWLWLCKVWYSILMRVEIAFVVVMEYDVLVKWNQWFISKKDIRQWDLCEQSLLKVGATMCKVCWPARYFWWGPAEINKLWIIQSSIWCWRSHLLIIAENRTMLPVRHPFLQLLELNTNAY